MTRKQNYSDQIEELKKLVLEMKEKNEQGNDKNFELPGLTDDKPKSAMLEIDVNNRDSYGDAVELATKTRLGNYKESYDVSIQFVEREYHNMIGNRYGKHSKLIPVNDAFDLNWFSGNDIKIIDIYGKKYYKIRLLVYDILIKKLLLMRIPTNDGLARNEEIHHVGAGRNLDQWLNEHAPLKKLSDSKNKPQVSENIKNESI